MAFRDVITGGWSSCCRLANSYSNEIQNSRKLLKRLPRFVNGVDVSFYGVVFTDLRKAHGILRFPGASALMTIFIGLPNGSVAPDRMKHVTYEPQMEHCRQLTGPGIVLSAAY